jgi:hypothetical protein
MEDMEDYFDFDKKKFRDPDHPFFPAETDENPPYPPSLHPPAPFRYDEDSGVEKKP